MLICTSRLSPSSSHPALACSRLFCVPYSRFSSPCTSTKISPSQTTLLQVLSRSLHSLWLDSKCVSPSLSSIPFLTSLLAPNPLPFALFPSSLNLLALPVFNSFGCMITADHVSQGQLQEPKWPSYSMTNLLVNASVTAGLSFQIKCI